MIRTRFTLALAASIAVHLAALTSPGWVLPGKEDRPALRLEGRLTPPPAPVVATEPAPAVVPSPKPGPKPRPRVAPAREAQPPAPVFAAAQEPILFVPEASEHEGQLEAFGPERRVEEQLHETKTPTVLAAAPAAQLENARLPQQGRIRYSVTLGQQHFIVGRAVQTWERDGVHYRLKSVTETTGLVGLFKPAKVVQVSQGTVSASGLIPDEFRSTRNDAGEASESAHFDWDGERITLRSRGKEREAPLAPGAQDVLSAIFQLSMAPPGGTSQDFMVATGKSYNRLTFDVVGELSLLTGVGEIRTLHLKTRGGQGEQTIELWLALDYRNLPVRLRFTDKKGKVADLIAAELEFEGVKLAEVLPQQ
jgi:hypothetical protein